MKGLGEVAQWVQVSTAKLGNMGLIFRPHTVAREKQLQQNVLELTHEHHDTKPSTTAYPTSHTNTCNKRFYKTRIKEKLKC